MDPAPQESASFRRTRQVFARIPETLEKNHKTFSWRDGAVDGFGAGDAYPQIWLRDSAWIVDAAGAFYPSDTLTSWLDLHLANATKDGRLRDWVAKGSAGAFREWAPRVDSQGDIAFDTNSNESDQEPSAALAFCRAERLLGDTAPRDDPRHTTRLSKITTAINALLRDRTDPKTGLVWSGLTADWGDVSPMYPDQRAIYLDARTPRTLALYSNVMVYGALDCLSSFVRPQGAHDALAARAEKLRDAIRSSFWMKERGYFKIRLPFDPAPVGFADGDGERFALGGNALATLFRVADDDQAGSIFETVERLRVAQDASTISTTLVPPYAAGVFQHPAMREPFQYQNGGQWDWFGAALVQAEFERGHSVMARTHLNQIVSRILHAGPGLHEWYGQDGLPQGSAAYAASAASIYNAVFQGAFGVSRATNGYRVVVRTGETVLPFDLPQRAANAQLTISQTVRDESVDVGVESNAPLSEICTVIPEGRTAVDMHAMDTAMPRSVVKIGNDALSCADVSAAPRPVHIRFGTISSR